MADHPFPWLSDPAPETAPTPSPREPVRPRAKEFARKIAPYALAASVLVALAVSRGSAGSESRGNTSPPLDVLVVMSPVPKGAAVWPEILKEIPVDRASLTKAQALQALRPQDLANLRGKLRAKKNLPPNKPLFWGDLDFIPQNALPEPPTTSVLFPKEGAR